MVPPYTAHVDNSEAMFNTAFEYLLYIMSEFSEIPPKIMELVFKKWIENVEAWSYNGAGMVYQA